METVDHNPLPPNPPALSDRLTALEHQLAEAYARICELEAENAELKRRLFGPKSERSEGGADRPPQPKRPKNDAKAQRKRRKNRQVRQELVAAEEVKHELDDADTCPDCGGSLTEMASRESIEWDYVPGRWVKRVHQRQTCICSACKAIHRAPAPDRPCDKSPYGAGLMAHVAVTKVADSVPLYRQVKQFDRLGIPMARSTLVDLFARVGSLLTPVWLMLQSKVRQAELVLADETPVKMQGQKSKAYMWVFACAASVAYVFSTNRSGKTPQQVLGGTPGILVCDAFTGYNEVSGVEGRDRGGCNCHARRKFEGKGGSASEHVLEFYRQIYVVEREAKELGIDGTAAHLRMRQERSAPVMDALKAWLDANKSAYGPKEPMGKAISYALNQWSELTLFLSDPKVPPDNNRSERLLRLIAIGRKNWLFAGHAEGGKHLAVVASVIATCELHGVNPQAYIQDLLLRVQTHPASRIDELHPKAWIENFGHLYDHAHARKQG